MMGDKFKQDNVIYLSTKNLFSRRPYNDGGQGYEDLRKYIKQGNDFCKDISAVMQERAELEAQYAKGLAKLAVKLFKSCKENPGTVAQSWTGVATQMEDECELHRSLSICISDKVVKPLRINIEAQNKVRKSVETMVDKTARSLSDWRNAEIKSKKQSFGCNRQNEKIQDLLLDAKMGKGKILSEKDLSKLDNKRRKAEEAVRRSEQDYFTFCLRAERSRLDWVSAVQKGSNCFQTLEEERLQNLSDILERYNCFFRDLGPRLTKSSEHLSSFISQCAVSSDLQSVTDMKKSLNSCPEQHLPDFYAENLSNLMSRYRRRETLNRFLILLKSDIDRERRGLAGVHNLAKALRETPNFGSEDSLQDVKDRLNHIRSMIAFFEAARFKLQKAYSELEGHQIPSHPLSKYIECVKDKQGICHSTLKVPNWFYEDDSSDLIEKLDEWTKRGTADGTSVQPDSDFDEFSSQGSDRDYQNEVIDPWIQQSSDFYDNGDKAEKCRALYDYDANLNDELSIRYGDIITIHDKQMSGWWYGELNGLFGIFPSTYVEEVK